MSEKAATAVSLIAIPYDSGRFDERMGRGPGALLADGLAERLTTRDRTVAVHSIRFPEEFYAEGRALVELQRRGVAAVREALQGGSRPILLSGNCGVAALTAISALGAQSTGVIWFDAHSDFNTPETSASGFFDGMCLAIMVGDCWPELAQSFDSFSPVPASQIIQVGARDIDRAEEARLKRSAIRRIGPRQLAQLPEAVGDLAERVAQVYVHVDLDVLDISEGRANTYACEGGLSVEELCESLALIARSVRIGAASITSYDPGADADDRIGRAIPRIAELLAQ